MFRIIEDYKNSDAFQDGMTKASERAFDNGFKSCRCLIIKQFFNFDLNKITIETALEAVAEVTFDVAAIQLPSTPSLEVPPTEVPVSSIEVITVEAPSEEKANEECSSAPLAKNSQAKA